MSPLSLQLPLALIFLNGSSDALINGLDQPSMKSFFQKKSSQALVMIGCAIHNSPQSENGGGGGGTGGDF